MEVNTKILSDITVFMKYARYLKDEQRRETWEEIVTRNKEMHLKKFPHIAEAINDAYELVYEKKVLPSMRSLQFAGKAADINPARLYNCSFMNMNDWHAFQETMFLLLSGAGVGVSVQKRHINKLPPIKKPNPNRHRRYVIEDSITGWADAVKHLMKSYFGFNTSTIVFDFSSIREKGIELVTSGGKAPGPQPLRECLVKIEGVLNNVKDGEKLRPIDVFDIVCYIAEAVLAGGIRRSSLITLFSKDDIEMMAAKSGAWWELNPQRSMSNNSVVFDRESTTYEEFERVWEYSRNSGSGEPGFYWSNNVDLGSNPCFSGKERLLTVDGYRTFEELCDVDDLKIYNSCGNIVDSKVWYSGEKETVKVTTSDGESTVCTPNHVWMLSDGSECLAKNLEGKKITKLYSIYDVTVDSVVDNGVEKVYDFSEPENHWGWVNGHIVHNCNEISLSDMGLCNLTEINASNIENELDFLKRCWVASLIGTLQASYTDFYYLRDSWQKNAEEQALLGVSMTGIASMKVMEYDLEKAMKVVKDTNEIIANLIGINKSWRLSAVKPAGTTSLVFGSSSGIHAWHDKYYIRRIRVNKTEAIYTYLLINHPEIIEDDWMRPDTTAIISIPIKAPDGAVTRDESSLDLLARVKEITKRWVHEGHVNGDNKNNVSCTVSVKEDEWSDVKEWAWVNRMDYSGISLLPHSDHTYKQAPFESCTKEEYERLSENLHEVDLSKVVELTNNTNLQGEQACAGGNCEIT